VWFLKPPAQAVSPKSVNSPLKMINIGCGSRFHGDWINMDVMPLDPAIRKIDALSGIPVETGSADVVYHSHLLEHLPKQMAPAFIAECFRVLKEGGLIRVVVPDLEQIARQYTEQLEKALKNEKGAEARYDWMMLEMFDQTVRNFPGGEMLRYWQQENIPEKEFIMKRVGSEAKWVMEAVQNNRNSRHGLNTSEETDPVKIGQFRLSGEIHQWMYDRYSLGRLLKQAGFREVRLCRADESSIPGFNSYLLDTEADGAVRKPDSLFMEAIK
jgi:predicted SAM-dependent methyltransferase